MLSDGEDSGLLSNLPAAWRDAELELSVNHI